MSRNPEPRLETLCEGTQEIRSEAVSCHADDNEAAIRRPEDFTPGELVTDIIPARGHRESNATDREKSYKSHDPTCHLQNPDAPAPHTLSRMYPGSFPQIPCGLAYWESDTGWPPDDRAM